MRPAAGNPDRDPRPLDRAGHEHRSLDAVMRSGVVYRFSREQAVDDLQPLVEHLGQDPGVGRLAERAVLGVNRGAEPTPRIARPRESRSSVVTSRASFHGRRRGIGVIAVPSLIRVVAYAIAPSATHESTMESSSHGNRECDPTARSRPIPDLLPSPQAPRVHPARRTSARGSHIAAASSQRARPGRRRPTRRRLLFVPPLAELLVGRAPNLVGWLLAAAEHRSSAKTHADANETWIRHTTLLQVEVLQRRPEPRTSRGRLLRTG